MKRLIVSSVLFLFIASLGIVGSVFIGSGYEKISSELDRSEQFMKSDNFEQAKDCAKKAEELFRKREPFFAAFVSHNTIDEVGSSLAAVAPLASKESREECLSQLTEARVALTHLHNDHRFILQNLF